MRPAAPLLLVAVAAGTSRPGQLAWLAVGDWGQPGPGLASVAAQLAREARRRAARFLLLLGDNFYPDGVSGAWDLQFASTYEAMLGAALPHIPHLAVLGNNDHKSHPEAQIERYYVQAAASQWTLPNPWYTREVRWHTSPTANSTALFIFLDTTVLVGAPGADEAQSLMHWAWLRKRLQATRADWVVAVGHHTVFSASVNGDTPELIAKLVPLLEAHGVDAYVGGHDHCLQVLSRGDAQSRDEGPLYIVAGGGGAKLDLKFKRPDHPLLRFWAARYGFASMQLNRTHLTSTLLSHKGYPRYRIVRRRRPKPLSL